MRAQPTSSFLRSASARRPSTITTTNHSKLVIVFASRHVSTWNSSSQPFGYSHGYTSDVDSKEPVKGPLRNAVSPKLTPRALKQHLDRFVVGQTRSKRILSTAVYHHYKRIQQLRQRQEELEEAERVAQQLNEDANGEIDYISKPPPPRSNGIGGIEMKSIKDDPPLTIEKSNILCLGPTGVGKTLMIRTLARVLEVPFSMSDCTPFTQAGYVGEDADVCVHRLLAASNWDVKKAEQGIVCLDEFDKLSKPRVNHGSKDIAGEGVQQALLKIIEGTTLTVNAKPDRRHPAGLPGGGFSAAGSTGSAKGETFQVDTSNILFIFTGAFSGMEKVITERVAKGSIGFNAPIGNLEPSAEFLFSHTPYFTPQRPENPSPAIATTTSARINSARPTNPSPSISTTSGTPLPSKVMKPKFNALELTEPADLIAYGLIPEIVGRIPIIAAVEPLTVDLLTQVLTEPSNSLVAQYTQLFSLSGVELRFTTPALREIAKAAEAMGTGARGLRTVLERLLGDAMFEAPGSSVRHVLVNEKVAKREIMPGYYARGQSHLFYAAWQGEEEEWAKKNGEMFEGGKLRAVGF